MQIIKQMIEKKVDKYNDYFIKKWYLKAFWQFYQALCLALAISRVFGLEDNLDKRGIKKRNALYVNMITRAKINEDDFRILNRFISKDFEIIFSSIEHIEKLNSNSETNVSDIEKDQFVGVLACEVEELGI